MGYLREDDLKDITDHVLRRKEFYTKLMSYCIHNPATFIGKEYLMVKNDLHETLYNNRYWGTIIEDISPINWLPDEATAIKVARNHDEFLTDMKQFILTLLVCHRYVNRVKRTQAINC